MANASFNDARVQREQPCRLCGGQQAHLLAETAYWDIRNTRIVGCDACGLMQLDPMLTGPETDRGCLAYYVEETLRTAPREQVRNLVRNYRRGVLFAWGLKAQGHRPRTLLELGPGSGYFAAGLRRIFPDLEVTVMDVNTEVLHLNARDHGFAGIRSMPEEHHTGLDDRFDLVVARDILEHVIDIGAVLRNVMHYLRPGGLFHFITPNGHEDVWKHRLRHHLGRERSELLINHVNYFDGRGLRQHLEQLGFDRVTYYTYDLKTTLRGRSWSRKPKLWAPVSRSRSAGEFAEDRLHEVQGVAHRKDEVLPSWYRRGPVWPLLLLSAYQHGHFLRVDPARGIGHEIHGVFRKRG